jgi:hypothetical protein
MGDSARGSNRRSMARGQPWLIYAVVVVVVVVVEFVGCDFAKGDSLCPMYLN